MPYKILQITDTHLFESFECEMFDVKTNEKFVQTVEFIKKKNFQFDGIFLTGDLSQDETEESYKILAESLSFFKKDIYWIPGNHDNFEVMQSVFSQYLLFHNEPIFSVPSIKTNFIFIDSTVEGKNSGFLTDSNLKLLLENLSSVDKNDNNVLVMHHHPVEVGTPLVDHYILENKEAFWKALQKATRKIKVIMCGHVHGDYKILVNDTRVISSPATCLQWKKGTDELILDKKSGFTMWDFSSNGVYEYETFFV